MTKDDKEYLDQKLDGMFVKWGLEFYKLNASVDVMNVTIDEVVKPKLDEIIAHAKETNGRVNCLEEEAIRVPKKKRARVFGFVVAAIFVIGLASAVSYHGINWVKTFTNKTKIELNEKAN